MPTLKSTILRNATRASLCFPAVMLLAFTYSSGAQNCPKAGTKDTDWSKLAIQLCQDSVTDQLHLEAPSPDGMKLLYVNGPARTVPYI
jgi:hypothetical protein